MTRSVAPSLLLFAFVACRQPSAERARAQEAPTGGWSVYDDASFRFETPPNTSVAIFTPSPKDPSPQFNIRPDSSDDLTGDVMFTVGEPEPTMLRQDAAASLLKKFAADGVRPLTDVRTIPMKTGSCAGFAMVGACSAARGDRCFEHMWVAQCDAPGGRRYLYMANLGASGNINQRPPGFDQNLAAQERILRSIEFKKG